MSMCYTNSNVGNCEQFMYIKGTKSRKLRAYCNRVAQYLDLDKSDTLIEIEFRSKCANNAGGYCHGDDNHILMEIAFNDGDGRIPGQLLMQNIAHEFIHAKQIAEGRLVNYGFYYSDKKAKKLSYKWIFDGVEYVNEPYKNHPWEHEAYELEDTVYRACRF